jgi:chromosome segregation ATPase
MTEDEQKALRSLLREEVNAAVYASEQRLGGQIGRLDERVGRLDQRVVGLDRRVGGLAEGLGRLDQCMNRFENQMNRVEGRLGKFEVGQQKMQVDLTQVITVLNEATKVINDVQASQIALELKVEDNSRSLKRDMQSLNENVQNFAREFMDINWKTTERILLHERTPIDKAHPRPNSTA